MKKRLFAVLLALTMLIGTISMGVMAAAAR